ncbi:MAG: hypothetical protein GXO64_02800 [Candidatus Micrarchaeota archaeon]|nr:hypothetical protein [Candidatus Micrarchaeota archaeon]
MQDMFSRQEFFIGKDNQKKLSDGSVAVVGCGSLGSFVISGLVRAGIGSIKIIDRDVVENPNLYANCIFKKSDIGKPKALVVKERMEGINSRCSIEAIVKNLDYENIDLLLDCDIIVVCTDNMAVRYLINDVAIKNGIPWIYGSVARDEGYMMPVNADGKPCFRCMFGDRKRSSTTCDESGVLLPIIQIVSSLQIYEVIKHFTNIGKSIHGQIIHVKLGEKESDIINVPPNPGCKTCSLRKFPSSTNKEYTVASICGKDSYQFKPKTPCKINISEFTKKLISAGLDAEDVKGLMIRIFHDDMKVTLFENGTAIIKANDKEKAKKLYERILTAIKCNE